jgi:4-amino-4-deoxychorismate lyase
MSVARVLVNGDPDAPVAPEDRGLSYGDGLFETILFVAGNAPLWHRHMARLAAGCARLLLPAPAPELLATEASAVSAGLPRAVVRIVITRGVAPRGYRVPDTTCTTRIVTASPAPDANGGWYHHGVQVRWCALRLSEQPALAGIKHLNRLEQVLARAEWSDEAVVEGLLCDQQERVISATSANLFVVIDGRLITPALDRCGVAGVARAELLAHAVDGRTRDLSVAELMQADEVFLSNSVRGIIPVVRLQDRRWAVGPITRELQAHWRRLGMSPEGA